MSRHFITATLIAIVGVLHPGCAARILGIFPFPSFSHQIAFRGLTLALRERGHELVVVTPNPINDPTLKNYTEIDVSFMYEHWRLDWISVAKKYTYYDFIMQSTPKFLTITEGILSHPELQKLYEPESRETFDLLLFEALRWPAVLLFAKRYEIPVIGITSMSPTPQVHYQFGNPIMPSQPPYWNGRGIGLEKLTFWQRLCNFVQTWRFLFHYRTTYMQTQQEIARKYFGNDIPDLCDLEKNVSLVFANQQAPISYVRPNVPKIIDIGGLHISDRLEPLSKDLRMILDEATQGFVYMSLGTNTKSASLSNEMRGEFIAAFSEIPYTVIWKYEDNLLPGQPDNVHTMKWIPQQSVLAHPNIKVFIYQGGLQSTEEAISHAVPVIGLPVLGDQTSNIDKIVSLGVGKKLDISSVDRFDLVEAIQSIVRDDSYKLSMLKLRDLVRDKPYDSLENAVWWTEYVIRHKGAPHLHSTTADDPWYQRQDIDLIFIISTAILAACTIALRVLYKLLAYSIYFLKHQHLIRKKEKVC
ncbi:UDP-glycosyltransferase UGT5-like [Neodiprion virginianus]|uniref:UDP-glycosyltransferase UGT5-like n=1 Tax=Neodiprion virginianus TaxID=2961670 RepID=UPI001EE75301|nr:UDP-glycosyltransferase UGT5-like [Neodiprion virginianus]